MQDPESAKAELTQAQFEQVEKQLRPVERYAINFRTDWCPAVDNRKTVQLLHEMQTSQHEEWELDKLEQEKEDMENEAEEELITAMDIDSDADVHEHTINTYRMAQRQIRVGRKLGKLTGSAWKILFEEGTQRKYYYNSDTKEQTWERPRILDGYIIIKDAYEKGWSAMVDSVLVRVFQYLEPFPDRIMSCSRVCRRWHMASKSLHLCTWVFSDHRKGTKEVLTVGNSIECLFESGEVWYPGTITDVLSNGKYVITYTDGVEEPNVDPNNVRGDLGLRYTLRHEEGSPPIGVLNKHLKSSFACGPNIPQPPHFLSLEQALSSASHGEEIVITSGVHTIDKQIHIRHGKAIKLIGERRFAKSRQLYRTAFKLVWGDQPQAISRLSASQKPRLLNRAIRPPRDAILQQFKHPLHNIDIIGLEAMTLKEKRMEPATAVLLTPHSTEMNPYACRQRSAIQLQRGVITISENCVLDGVGIFGKEQCVKVTGGECVIMKRCTLSNMHGEGACVEVCNSDTVVVITRCLVYNAPGTGILLKEGKLCCLKCEVCSNREGGVVVDSGSFVVSECSIHGNSVGGLVIRGNSELVIGEVIDSEVVCNTIGMKSINELDSIDVVNTSLEYEYSSGDDSVKDIKLSDQVVLSTGKKRAIGMKGGGRRKKMKRG